LGAARRGWEKGLGDQSKKPGSREGKKNPDPLKEEKCRVTQRKYQKRSPTGLPQRKNAKAKGELDNFKKSGKRKGEKTHT